AIIGLARLRYDYPRLATPALLTICIGQAWLLLFVPFVVVHLFVPFAQTQGGPPSALACALAALVGVAGAAVLFFTTQPGMNDCPTDTPRWLRQAAASAL